MRKLVLIASLFILLPIIGYSQYNWDYGGKIGPSDYLGSIGGINSDEHRRDFVDDMQLKETGWQIGGYVRYKIRDPWSVEAQLSWIRIQGADSLSNYAPRKIRDLTFRNDMIQLNVMGEWTFFENPDLGNTYRYENSFGLYLCAGISIFYQDPYAYNPYRIKFNSAGAEVSVGNGPRWVSLHNLYTENTPFKGHYIQPGIPVGAGFNFTLKKRYRIGWSMTYTKTFTDVLDGASGTYPDQTQWNNMTYEEKYFSDPTLYTAQGQDYINKYGTPNGIQIGSYGPYPDNSEYPNQRGGKVPELYYKGTYANTDSFITTTVDFGYVIRGTSSIYRAHYSGLFSKNRFKVRRRRAKF
ncbi:MAG: outer membrane beta-barrel protein [Bacteroidia bacterium]